MITVNDKKVDDVELDGIDLRDAPDFCDAFVSKAWFEDGTELTQAEIDMITDDQILAEVEKQLY